MRARTILPRGWHLVRHVALQKFYYFLNQVKLQDTDQLVTLPTSLQELLSQKCSEGQLCTE